MTPQAIAQIQPAHIIATVVPVENVFDDPNAIIEGLNRRAPFNLIYGKQGYEKSGGAEPWFRQHWVSDGVIKVAEAEPLLHNPRLIQGAREAFGATVIRPRGMIWNVLGPMLAGRPHFDISPYRGLDQSTPLWLHVVIHNSQLFHHWAVPSTTGLILFYHGQQGGFEYWPDGPDQPSVREEPPFWNVGLVTDNEFMFHRPLAIGRPNERIRPGEIGGEATLHRTADGHNWQVIDDSGVRCTWAPESLRYSLVWKALAFKDERAAAVYDNHSDDLTQEIIWRVFADDIRARGSKVSVPKEPLTDRAFRGALLTEYPNPGLRYFEDARRA
jgi:hypothetical protein